MLVIKRNRPKVPPEKPSIPLKAQSETIKIFLHSRGKKEVQSVPVVERNGVWAVIKRDKTFGVTHIPTGLGVGHPFDPADLAWKRKEATAILHFLSDSLGKDFGADFELGQGLSDEDKERARTIFYAWCNENSID